MPVDVKTTLKKYHICQKNPDHMSYFVSGNPDLIRRGMCGVVRCIQQLATQPLRTRQGSETREKQARTRTGYALNTLQ